VNKFFSLANQKVPVDLACKNGGLGLRSSQKVEVIDKKTYEENISNKKELKKIIKIE
jgi:hypothetical protein